MRLFSGNALTDVTIARGKVFGELVKLAIGRLNDYHSDLYHDATWLQEYMSGDRFEFFWSVDATGTTIGTEPIALREYAFRLTVTCVRGRIDLTVTGPTERATLATEHPTRSGAAGPQS